MTRRDDTRLLNQIIDHALTEPGPAQQQALLALVTPENLQALAERLRRRATRLGRRERQQAQDILAVRNELLMALYAAIAPAGWANAWCDGSSIKDNATHRAGIGAVIMDTSGKCIAKISHSVGEKTAFEAEIAALVAVLESAVAHDIERLRVHTDCKALVQLWCEQRDDQRLAAIQSYLSRCKRLEIQAIPRLHNQTAHALAKQAVSNKT